MAPSSYPDLSWSGRFSQTIRTLQVIAVAGAIGVIAGGVGALALLHLSNDDAGTSATAGASKESNMASQQALASQPAKSAPKQQSAPELAPTAPANVVAAPLAPVEAPTPSAPPSPPPQSAAAEPDHDTSSAITRPGHTGHTSAVARSAAQRSNRTLYDRAESTASSTDSSTDAAAERTGPLAHDRRRAVARKRTAKATRRPGEPLIIMAPRDPYEQRYTWGEGRWDGPRWGGSPFGGGW